MFNNSFKKINKKEFFMSLRVFKKNIKRKIFLYCHVHMDKIYLINFLNKINFLN